MFITQMIMRDVSNGWIVRYTHANVASFFFIFVYALNYKFINSKLLSCSNNKIINLCKLILTLYLLFKIAIFEAFLKIFNPFGFSRLSNLDFKNIDNNFLQWFVGFSDAEGSFIIQTKATHNSEVNFCFKITPYMIQNTLLRYSTINTNLHHAVNNLNPNWVSGFADAEGCFKITVREQSKLSTGWSVSASFSINLHA